MNKTLTPFLQCNSANCTATLKLNKGIGTIKVNDEEIKNDTTIGTGDNIINISGGVGSINIDFKE